TDDEQYDAAGAVFKNLIASEPNNGTNYYYYGENFLLSDNSDSALIIYKKGQSVDPNNPLLKIGLAKYDLDKYSILEMKVLSDLEAQNAAKAKTNESQAKANEAEAK